MDVAINLQCAECRQWLPCRNELVRHVTVDHIGWTPYQCVYCQDVFLPTEAAARTHCANIHAGRAIKFTFNTNDKRQKELNQLLERSMLNKSTPPQLIIKAAPPPISLKVLDGAAANDANALEQMLSVSTTVPTPRSAQPLSRSSSTSTPIPSVPVQQTTTSFTPTPTSVVESPEVEQLWSTTKIGGKAAKRHRRMVVSPEITVEDPMPTVEVEQSADAQHFSGGQTKQSRCRRKASTESSDDVAPILDEEEMVSPNEQPSNIQEDYITCKMCGRGSVAVRNKMARHCLQHADLPPGTYMTWINRPLSFPGMNDLMINCFEHSLDLTPRAANNVCKTRSQTRPQRYPSTRGDVSREKKCNRCHKLVSVPKVSEHVYFHLKENERFPRYECTMDGCGYVSHRIGNVRLHIGNGHKHTVHNGEPIDDLIKDNTERLRGNFEVVKYECFSHEAQANNHANDDADTSLERSEMDTGTFDSAGNNGGHNGARVKRENVNV